MRPVLPASCIAVCFFKAFLSSVACAADPPLCSATASDGTLLELRIDDPLPGTLIDGTGTCPETVTVLGVASAIGLPPRLDIAFVLDQSGSANACSGADIDDD